MKETIDVEQETAAALPRTVDFAPLAEVCTVPLPFGTAWLLSGDSGIGKSVFGFHFAVQGLRRGESVVYVSADDSPSRLRANLDGFGFHTRPYESMGRLIVVDAFSEGGGEKFRVLDRSDPEEMIFVIGECIAGAAPPVRVVLDSMTSVAAYLDVKELTWFVYEKNRILKHNNAVHLDLYLRESLAGERSCLSNAYDVTISLEYTEEQGGFPRRRLRVSKVRGGTFDPRPYPFDIEPHQGIVVENDYYRRELGARGRNNLPA